LIVAFLLLEQQMLWRPLAMTCTMWYTHCGIWLHQLIVFFFGIDCIVFIFYLFVLFLVCLFTLWWLPDATLSLQLTMACAYSFLLFLVWEQRKCAAQCTILQKPKQPHSTKCNNYATMTNDATPPSNNAQCCGTKHNAQHNVQHHDMMHNTQCHCQWLLTLQHMLRANA